MAIFNQNFDALNTYTEEMLSKFLLQQEPMSKWDDFQQGLKDMGVEELLKMYTGAYNRIMGK